MTVRASWFVPLLALGSASAFIFIPQRGEFAASWTVPGLAEAAWIRSDLDANLYLAQARDVTAYAAGGERLWTYRLPTGFAVSEGIVPAEDCALLVGRDSADPAQTHLVCLEAEPNAQGQARVRWLRRARGVPANGLHVPLHPDREKGDFGFAALVTDGQLVLLSLTDGEPLATQPIGEPLAAPVWDGLTGFVAVSPQREVLRLRLGPALEISERRALPPGPTLQGLRWDSRERRLFVDAGNRLWVLEFVFIPNRGEEAAGLLIVDESNAATIGSTLDQIYIGRQNRLEAIDTRTGQPLWSYELPAGEVIREPPVAAQELVVVVGRAPQGSATVAALAPADGRLLWQQTVPNLAVGGFRLPVRDDGRHRSALGLLAEGELRVLEPLTGKPLASRHLGAFAGAPLWLDDSGFILTSDGDPAGTGPAVVGFDLLATGREDDPSRHWNWRIPAAETIESLQWLEVGRLLVIRGRQNSYVFD